MPRTLKAVALELLELYKEAQTSLIWEYSGSISMDVKKLEGKCDAYKEEIERLADGE